MPSRLSKTLASQVGSRIQELRQIRRLTQAGLGMRCGMSQKYVSAAERGRKNLQLDTLEKIARGLEVEPYMLLVPAPHRDLPDITTLREKLEGILKTRDPRSQAFLMGVMEMFETYRAEK